MMHSTTHQSHASWASWPVALCPVLVPAGTSRSPLTHCQQLICSIYLAGCPAFQLHCAISRDVPQLAQHCHAGLALLPETGQQGALPPTAPHTCTCYTTTAQLTWKANHVQHTARTKHTSTGQTDTTCWSGKQWCDAAVMCVLHAPWLLALLGPSITSRHPQPSTCTRL
jgi:hypothetical protein